MMALLNFLLMKGYNKEEKVEEEIFSTVFLLKICVRSSEPASLLKATCSYLNLSGRPISILVLWLHATSLSSVSLSLRFCSSAVKAASIINDPINSLHCFFIELSEWWRAVRSRAESCARVWISTSAACWERERNRSRPNLWKLIVLTWQICIQDVHLISLWVPWIVFVTLKGVKWHSLK